jgi:hypothetical protein
MEETSFSRYVRLRHDNVVREWWLSLFSFDGYIRMRDLQGLAVSRDMLVCGMHLL